MPKKPTTKEDKEAAYDDLEMSVLYKISRAVAQRKNVHDLITETLDILDGEMGLMRGTVTLRDGDYLFIEAAAGMDAESIRRGVYKIGEGVTGLVAAQAKSVAIPDISKNERFLDKTRTRRYTQDKIAFVCVPIIYMEQVIGTLSIDRISDTVVDLNRDLVLLETISNILADALAMIYLRREERNRLLDENRRLKLELSTELMRPKNILGNSGAMQKFYRELAKAAPLSTPIFLRGATGTGKELAARAVFESNEAFSERFNVVNCAALPDYSLVGEIFGYEKDSPELGLSAKEGLLEKYPHSTFFFDEVSEISLPAQKMIADFLSVGRFRRLNGSAEISAKARMIFASSIDIEKLLEQKLFDENLYAAISQNMIYLPALRDRKSDILLLAEHFVEKYSKIHHKDIRRISTPAINMMTIYAWPGNVRELENCIERAVISSHDSAISGYNLTPAVRSAYMHRKLPYGEDVDFISIVESFERELITEALKANRGNAAAAARRLNLTERIINYKIKKYSITTSWYKSGR